jgi:hypothetical protein
MKLAWADVGFFLFHSEITTTRRPLRLLFYSATKPNSGM